MFPNAATLSMLLGWGTLILQMAILVVLIAFVRERFKGSAELALGLGKWALQIGLLLTVVGSALTLVYSEIFGILPCGLCWLQRVFLYPQVVLFAVALVKKDFGVGRYIVALSIPGLLVALYHHFIQVGGTSFLPCPATPGAADCAQRFVFELGYITFPLMAATLFAALMLVGYLASRRTT